MSILISGIKIDDTKQELNDKIKELEKISIHKSQVELYCNDIKDENCFVTAWNYINENVSDKKYQETNIKMKRIVVEIFCQNTTIN